MNPFTLLTLFLLVALTAAVVPYIIGKRALQRKARERENDTYLIVAERIAESGLSIGDRPESAELREAREKFRSEEDAKSRYLREAATVDTGAVKAAATQAARAAGWPSARGKHPVLGVGYRNERGEKVDGRGIRTRSVFLTPRQLERVNTARRAAGRPMLNRAGFASAVAHAWDQPVRQPDNSNQWLTYLIVYECLFADHQTDRSSANIGLTIVPDAPYNGHGGEYAGAGASGDWTSPDASTAAAAAAITVGAGITDDRPIEPSLTGNGYHYADPLSDPGSFKGSSDNDPAQAPSAPEPSYSAPDTSSSYTSSDSGSSSSSYDSGSSSGGGDSGGGGGDGS